MKRAFTFTERNLKELLRDPLSYIFCIGFPIVMLLLMTVIDSTIPAEANMTLFRIDNLAPGTAVFGLSFIMLFATLSVSKDRSGAFLNRLFSSPMRSFDFIAGYTLPLLLITVLQLAVLYLTSFIIALSVGVSLNILNVLLSCAVLIPMSVFLISVGIFFGTLFSDKSAPPCSSIIISLCGVMGGIWFDLSTIPEDNIFSIICRILPFCHATDAARAAVSGNYSNITVHLLITLVWAVIASVIAIVTFKFKMRSEKK